MDNYSKPFVPCTPDDKNIPDDDDASDVDFTSLNELEWEFQNMNGRASVTPPPRNVVAELAAIDAMLEDLDLSEDEPQAALSTEEPEATAQADRSAEVRRAAYEAQDAATPPSPAPKQPNVQHAKRWRDTDNAQRARRSAAAQELRRARAEVKKAATVERRRAKDRERKAAERAQAKPAAARTFGKAELKAILAQIPVRERELTAAIQGAPHDQRMIQAKGREADYSRWWAALHIGHAKLGREPSLSELAGTRNVIDRAGTYTRQMARRGLEKTRAIIAGGIWPEPSCVTLPEHADTAVSPSPIPTSDCVTLPESADASCVTLQLPLAAPNVADATVSPSSIRELPWCV